MKKESKVLAEDESEFANTNCSMRHQVTWYWRFLDVSKFSSKTFRFIGDFLYLFGLSTGLGVLVSFINEKLDPNFA